MNPMAVASTALAVGIFFMIVRWAYRSYGLVGSVVAVVLIATWLAIGAWQGGHL